MQNDNLLYLFRDRAIKAFSGTFTNFVHKKFCHEGHHFAIMLTAVHIHCVAYLYAGVVLR